MTTEDSPFEDRATAILSCVFRGMHHCPKITKDPRYWEVSAPDGFATFDFDELTRLVLSAHKYCVRAEIRTGGARRIKIFLSPRSRDGSTVSSHPTIEQAIAKFNATEFR